MHSTTGNMLSFQRQYPLKLDHQFILGRMTFHSALAVQWEAVADIRRKAKSLELVTRIYKYVHAYDMMFCNYLFLFCTHITLVADASPGDHAYKRGRPRHHQEQRTSLDHCSQCVGFMSGSEDVPSPRRSTIHPDVHSMPRILHVDDHPS